MRIKSIIISWDFLVALIIAVIFGLCTFFVIEFNVFKDISKAFVEIIVPTFSIMFPLFFAALTIIITSSDDGFAQFLQEKGFYQHILSTYKFTLSLVFVTFILSIGLSISLDYLFLYSHRNVSQIVMMFFFFIVFYSLFATFNSILDSIKYAQYRGLYFKSRKN